MNPNLKPWQLVYVKGSNNVGEHFIGELVSFPTPEGTIMVRKVPGHPGTAVELPVADVLDPVEAGEYWVHYAMVRGNPKTFPKDMLRYDSCVPVNFKVEYTNVAHRAVLDEGENNYLVAAVLARRFDQFTEDRWRSFGWVIEQRLDSEGPFKVAA